MYAKVYSSATQVLGVEPPRPFEHYTPAAAAAAPGWDQVQQPSGLGPAAGEFAHGQVGHRHASVRQPASGPRTTAAVGAPAAALAAGLLARRPDLRRSHPGARPAPTQSTLGAHNTHSHTLIAGTAAMPHTLQWCIQSKEKISHVLRQHCHTLLSNFAAKRRPLTVIFAERGPED